MDGDLLAVAYLQAWKKQDPGLLQGCVLSGESGIGIGRHKQYATGFYDHVTRVRADEARGLVWAAADNRWGRGRTVRPPHMLSSVPLEFEASCSILGCGNGMYRVSGKQTYGKVSLTAISWEKKAFRDVALRVVCVCVA